MRQLVSTADLIGIAQSTFISDGSAGFSFTRLLKGQRTPGIEFQFRRKLKPAAGDGGAGFCTIEIHPGETYLIYTANGEVLRAAPQSASAETVLPVKDELALVSQVLKARESASLPGTRR